jgi:hypothetical protein
MPEHGHHHHLNAVVVAHSCHEPAHHHHHCGDCHCDDEPADAGLTANDCDHHSHTCQVCAFLARTISQPAQFTASIDWRPLAAGSVVLPQSIYSSAILGPHAARGPPGRLA